MKPSEEQIKQAQELVDNGFPQAAGYRIIVKPLESTKGLKKGEAERFETLAASNFVTQSTSQTERESRGSDKGIVCSIGRGAYQSESMCHDLPWCLPGDVVVFHRYAGHRVEIPEGSGDFYQAMNDEDIFANYGNLGGEA